MKFLLDTNACLDFLLGRSSTLAAKVEQSFVTLAVSAISAAELRVGSRTSQEPKEDERRLDLFLSALVIPPFDQAAAAIYGELVRRIGVRRNGFDRLIAAHALALDLTLVTNNERDFADVPGLRVENWTR